MKKSPKCQCCKSKLGAPHKICNETSRTPNNPSNQKVCLPCICGLIFDPPTQKNSKANLNMPNTDEKFIKSTEAHYLHQPNSRKTEKIEISFQSRPVNKNQIKYCPRPENKLIKNKNGVRSQYLSDTNNVAKTESRYAQQPSSKFKAGPRPFSSSFESCLPPFRLGYRAPGQNVRSKCVQLPDYTAIRCDIKNPAKTPLTCWNHKLNGLDAPEIQTYQDPFFDKCENTQIVKCSRQVDKLISTEPLECLENYAEGADNCPHAGKANVRRVSKPLNRFAITLPSGCKDLSGYQNEGDTKAETLCPPCSPLMFTDTSNKKACGFRPGKFELADDDCGFDCSNSPWVFTDDTERTTVYRKSYPPLPCSAYRGRRPFKPKPTICTYNKVKPKTTVMYVVERDYPCIDDPEKYQYSEEVSQQT